MIYFDNGATTFPKPAKVQNAVVRAMLEYGANPGRSGYKMAIETATKVYETREKAKELFNASSPTDIVFTSNCTHALNLAIKGLLKKGDHVIISDLEHNSVLRPVHTLSQRGLITYSIVKTMDSDAETVKSFEKLIKDNTKLIICTHGSNVWGIKLPVEQLGRLAKRKKVFFLVDAAQTAGIIPIDVKKSNIDFLCMPGHKGLYGPSGTGMLITSKAYELSTIIEGGTGSMSSLYTQPDVAPEMLESGTVNTVGIIGLGAGISYVKSKTAEKIYEHGMEIAEYIYNNLKNNSGVILYTKMFSRNKNLPVVSFNIKDMMSEDTVSRLAEMGFALRGGLHCSPLAHTKMNTMDIGACRISIGSFNTLSEAKKLCAAINKITNNEANKKPKKKLRKQK